MRYHDFNTEKPPINELCLFVSRKVTINKDEAYIETKFKFGLYDGKNTHDNTCYSVIDTNDFHQWIRAKEMDDILITQS